MFQIDDQFLATLGLAALPQDEKEKLKAHIYETLEMRVGMKLASGMTDQQLTEFEGFMSGDPTKSTDYLNRIYPQWQNDANLKASLENERAYAQQQNIPSNPNAVISEFAALKWLETNFPNYKQVVADELDKLKAEISEAAPQILAASGVAPAGQEPAPMQNLENPSMQQSIDYTQPQQGFGPQQTSPQPQNPQQFTPPPQQQ